MTGNTAPTPLPSSQPSAGTNPTAGTSQGGAPIPPPGTTGSSGGSSAGPGSTGSTTNTQQGVSSGGTAGNETGLGNIGPQTDKERRAQERMDRAMKSICTGC
jgi:hypothetical protein